jgi:predicted XRE-type DNA-binding protein
MTKKLDVTPSSGNVFADLGLPNADELLAKAELVRQISKAIEARGLTQKEAAAVTGTTQPKISELLRGHLSGFSMDRLIRFLNALDRDVEIIVKKKPRSRDHGKVKVSAA